MNNLGRFLIFINIFLVSCQEEAIVENKYIKHIDKFNKTLSLQGEQIILEPQPIGAWVPNVLDSLILFRMNGDSCHVKIYNVNNGKFICDMFPVGRGNGESVRWGEYRQNYVDENGATGLWVEADRVLGAFNVCESLKVDSVIYDRRIDLNHQKFFLYQKFVMGDCELLGKMIRLNRTPVYVKYDYCEGKVTEILKIYREISEKVSDPLFSSVDVMSPDARKVALGMISFDLLHIVSLDNSRIISINMGDESLNYKVVLKIPKKDAKAYYRHLVASRKFIWALYQNCTQQELRKRRGTEILVFDWEGNPEYRLLVPEQFNYMTLDEKGGFLYGLSTHEGEQLFRYDVSEILNGM